MKLIIQNKFGYVIFEINWDFLLKPLILIPA